MNRSPGYVLRQIMVDLGLGVFPPQKAVQGTWPIYHDGLPSSPDDVISVEDTDGHDDGRSMVDGTLFYHYGIQIIVRSQDGRTGWDKAEQIRQALAKQVYAHTVTLDLNSVNQQTYYVHCIAHIGQVISVGKESPTSKRSIHTLNCSVPAGPVSSILT